MVMCRSGAARRSYHFPLAFSIAAWVDRCRWWVKLQRRVTLITLHVAEWSPQAGALQCHRPSARGLPEHDPPPTAWRGECAQRGLCPNCDLPCASRAAERLYAVGVHGRTGAPVPKIAAAGAERVRSLDPDIVRVEREGQATRHTGTSGAD